MSDIDRQINQWRAKVSDQVNSDLLDLASRMIIDLWDSVVDRTFAGMDIHGNPFIGYSRAHRERRKAMGLPVDHVDLFFEGIMIPSVKTREELIFDGAMGTAYFDDAFEEMKAEAHHKGLGNLPQREWFGFSEEQKADAYKLAMDFMKGKGYAVL